MYLTPVVTAVSVCDAADITCLNGGECQATSELTGDPFTCTCTEDYTGTYCQG